MAEQRNKDKTVECGRVHFAMQARRCTILYVRNMISGAQQAAVAILVVSVWRGEFGKTREHGLLAMALVRAPPLCAATDRFAQQAAITAAKHDAMRAALFADANALNAALN